MNADETEIKVRPPEDFMNQFLEAPMKTFQSSCMSQEFTLLHVDLMWSKRDLWSALKLILSYHRFYNQTHDIYMSLV